MVYQEVKPPVASGPQYAHSCVAAVRCNQCEGCLRDKQRKLRAAVLHETTWAKSVYFGTWTLSPQSRFKALSVARRDFAARNGGGSYDAAVPADRRSYLDAAVWRTFIAPMLKRVHRGAEADGEDVVIRHLFHAEEHANGELHLHSVMWSNIQLSRRLWENEYVDLPSSGRRKRMTGKRGVSVAEDRRSWRIGHSKVTVFDASSETFQDDVWKFTNYTLKYVLKNPGYRVRHSKNLGLSLDELSMAAHNLRVERNLGELERKLREAGQADLACAVRATFARVDRRTPDQLMLASSLRGWDFQRVGVSMTVGTASSLTPEAAAAMEAFRSAFDAAEAAFYAVKRAEAEAAGRPFMAGKVQFDVVAFIRDYPWPDIAKSKSGVENSPEQFGDDPPF